MVGLLLQKRLTNAERVLSCENSKNPANVIHILHNIEVRTNPHARYLLTDANSCNPSPRHSPGSE